MMRMGKLSAYGAIVIALLVLAFAILMGPFAVLPVPRGIASGVAVLLALGGYRTLKGLSGGLRLLAGAWGVALGIALMPLIVAVGGMSQSVWREFGVLVISPSVIALAGLALAVLHKER